MKPTTNATPDKKTFPLVDYDFQSTALGGFNGRCASKSNSLRDISREYFDGEASRDLLGEVAVYGTLILSAAVPLVSGAFAVIELCRAVAF